MSTTTEPVPSYCLEPWSNECPVTWSITVIVSDVPAIFSTVGLKSKLSAKGNVDDGAGSSGSTVVATNTGISSYSIIPETAV